MSDFERPQDAAPVEGLCSSDAIPLLSIVIPTYNRANLLEVLLSSIRQEDGKWPCDVEVLVLDNASSDHTPAVAEKALAGGLPLIYIRNSNNIGMDANLSKCFSHARGKYFWQIGDDEILYRGALFHVLEICRKRDFGVLHLSAGDIVDGTQADVLEIRIPNHLDMLEMDRETLLRRANVFLTFISTNVVNRQAVVERVEGFTHDGEPGTFLPQLAWIFSALAVCERHLYIETPVMGALTGNSGGYRLIEVFGFNLSRLTEKHLSTVMPNAKRIMSNAALMRVVASEIWSQRTNGGNKNRFATEDLRDALKTCFGHSLYFNLLVSKVAFSPLRVASIFHILTSIFNRLNRLLGFRLL